MHQSCFSHYSKSSPCQPHLRILTNPLITTMLTCPQNPAVITRNCYNWCSPKNLLSDWSLHCNIDMAGIVTTQLDCTQSHTRIAMLLWFPGGLQKAVWLHPLHIFIDKQSQELWHTMQAHYKRAAFKPECKYANFLYLSCYLSCSVHLKSYNTIFKQPIGPHRHL